MSRAWKRLAERASKSAYSAEEVADCVGPALASDWNREVRPSFSEALMDVLRKEPSSQLFETQRVQDIDQLAGQSASPFEEILVQVVADAVHQGNFGAEAENAAIVSAISERANRCIRSVEEHWHRSGASNSAISVRSRLEGAVQNSHSAEIAQQIRSGSKPKSQPVQRRDGLDDGVKF
jgi:hypothetical protein